MRQGTFDVVVIATNRGETMEIVIRDITFNQIKTLKQLHGEDNVMPCLIINEKEV